MKKVITMVGTSLFENYFDKGGELTVKNHYEYLKEKRENEWKSEERRIKLLRNEIEEWINRENDKSNISAEIKSLIKIKEELKEDLEIYLLYSDTILSKLAADIIKKMLPSIQSLNLGNSDDVKIKVIEGLQIWDRKEFNKGMSNLISEIYSIANWNWQDVIINITGGYKATIPYLTILAQLNECPIYYIFEKTDALIKIPNIPFTTEWINWNELSNYTDWFEKLEKGISDDKTFYDLQNSDFYKNYSFLVWEDKPLAELNPIGKIIYEKLKGNFFVFHTTDEVWNKLSNNEKLKIIVANKFSNTQIRDNKTEIKNGHKVYDDGNNQFRVFYFVEKDRVYVYKVFDNHNEYEKYLNEEPFNEGKIRNFAYKIFKLGKEEVSHV